MTVVPSQDGQAALVLVPLDQDTVTTPTAEGEDPLPAVVDAIRAAGEAAAAGGEVHIAGPAGLIADFAAAFAGIDGLLLLVALSAVLVILVLVYRAVALPFVVLFTSISALAGAGGVVYLLAKNDVLPLNGQSQGILFILVVGAATDYGLLLVSRYREELTQVDSKWTAMRRAWRACIEPIAASAGTVIIGLLCLLLSDLNSNRSLGPVGAIGIASAFVAAMTLLPALLMAGRWLFWPRIPRPPCTMVGTRPRPRLRARTPRGCRWTTWIWTALNWTTQTTGPNRARRPTARADCGDGSPCWSGGIRGGSGSSPPSPWRSPACSCRP